MNEWKIFQVIESIILFTSIVVKLNKIVYTSHDFAGFFLEFAEVGKGEGEDEQNEPCISI